MATNAMRWRASGSSCWKRGPRLAGSRGNAMVSVPPSGASVAGPSGPASGPESNSRSIVAAAPIARSVSAMRSASASGTCLLMTWGVPPNSRVGDAGRQGGDAHELALDFGHVRAVRDVSLQNNAVKHPILVLAVTRDAASLIATARVVPKKRTAKPLAVKIQCAAAGLPYMNRHRSSGLPERSLHTIRAPHTRHRYAPCIEPSPSPSAPSGAVSAPCGSTLTGSPSSAMQSAHGAEVAVIVGSQ